MWRQWFDAMRTGVWVKLISIPNLLGIIIKTFNPQHRFILFSLFKGCSIRPLNSSIRFSLRCASFRTAYFPFRLSFRTNAVCRIDFPLANRHDTLHAQQNADLIWLPHFYVLEYKIVYLANAQTKRILWAADCNYRSSNTFFVVVFLFRFVSVFAIPFMFRLWK